MAPSMSRSCSSDLIQEVVAHVPDLVVYGSLSRETPYAEECNGVLLYADISGFNELVEFMISTCQKRYGADQLTRTLNKYISEVVNHVLKSGGDILYFTGDSLVALWKVEREQLRDVITLAVACAMNIQLYCGVWDTKMGVELQIKIGISGGRLSKVVIGSSGKKYFLILGRAVDEGRLAAGLGEYNVVILSPNAWELCDRDNILIKKIENERAVKLRGIRRKPEFDLSEHIGQYSSHLPHEGYAYDLFRQASGLSANPELEDALRKYVMDTVLQKIDDGQPLEHLSEMRPVAILLLNLQFRDNMMIKQQCTAMQDVSCGITELLQKYQGKINKVFMFNKGCTFLCVFGLPGDKQEDECAHALQCAFQMHIYCTEKLLESGMASISVTSGPVFSGVIGHPFRHEYTVIGRKVSLAGSMRMHYPGLVSCDEDTYRNCKMPPYFFSELPKKVMKGVENPGTIYEYLGKEKKTMIGKSYLTMERNHNHPLLGRAKEIEVFTRALNRFLNCETNLRLYCHRAVIYEGPSGYGKSKILAEISYLAQKPGHKVVALELVKMNREQPFYTLQTLMARLMKIDVCDDCIERKKILQHKFPEPENQELLCLLNNLFQVKFPLSQIVSLMDPETRSKERERFLIKVLQQAVEKETFLCIIDQAHYIDVVSWKFLLELFNTVPIFLIMALCPFSPAQPICTSVMKIMKSEKTLYVRLNELEPSIISELACQTLGVISIPTELEILLVERSYGIPYYCKELLKTLAVNKLIELYPVVKEAELDILFTNSQNSTTNKVGKRHDESHKLLIKRELRKSIRITPLVTESMEEAGLYSCRLRKDANLQNIPLPLSLRGIALSHLEQMSSEEQLVVKCAAVIGQTFTTKLLYHIFPDDSGRKLAATLISLLKSQMIECGSRKNAFNMLTAAHPDPIRSQFCFCPFTASEEKESELEEEPEKTWPCKVMRFCCPLLQETACELWTGEKLKALHLKCASVLENYAHKCSSCGGGDFIFGHSLMVDMVPREPELSVWALEDIISENASVLTEATVQMFWIAEKDAESVVESLRSSDSEMESEATEESERDLEYMKEGKNATGIPKPLARPVQESYDSERMAFQEQSVTRSVSQNRMMPDVAPSYETKFLEKLDWVLQQYKEKAHLEASECKCSFIMDSVTSALARHWRAVGNLSKSLYYLLETAAAALYLSNNYMALSFLHKASRLKEVRKDGAYDSSVSELEIKKVKISRFEKACLFGLKGEVLFNAGQIAEAEDMLKKALQLLRCSFPLNTISLYFKFLVEKLKSSIHQRRNFHSTNKAQLPYIHKQIQCLSLLWQIYSMNPRPQSKLRAILAVTMQVNSAKKSSNKAEIISSYMDYFQCCQSMGSLEHCKDFAVMAMQLSAQLPFTKESILVIAQLSYALANIKLCFGHLKEASEFGYYSHHLAVLLNKPKLEYVVLPILFKALILSNRYNESITVMHGLKTFTDSNQMILATGWYYTLCLDILLQCGFALESFEDCLDFVFRHHTNSILLAENQLMLNIFSSLALWFARLENWDLFEPAYKKAVKLVPQTNASFFALCGFAKFLECQVLRLRKAMVERNDNVEKILTETLKQLAEFEFRCRTTPIYYARMYRLKAFVFLLCGKQKEAVELLQRGLAMTQEVGNKLEECWLRLNKDLWFGGKKASVDRWRATVLKMPRWEEVANMKHEQLYRAKYLLDLPRSVYSVTIEDNVASATLRVA